MPDDPNAHGSGDPGTGQGDKPPDNKADEQRSDGGGTPPKDQRTDKKDDDGKTVRMTQDEFDRVIKDRLERGRKTAVEEFLKSKGLSADEIDDIVKKNKELGDSQKTDIQRIEERAVKAEKSAEDWKFKATFFQLQSIALGAGVKDTAKGYVIDRIREHIGSLADKEIEAAGNDPEKIAKTFLEKLKKEEPEVFASAKEPAKAPPSPPASKSGDAKVPDAWKQSPDDWRKRKEQLGLAG